MRDPVFIANCGTTMLYNIVFNKHFHVRFKFIEYPAMNKFDIGRHVTAQKMSLSVVAVCIDVDVFIDG